MTIDPDRAHHVARRWVGERQQKAVALSFVNALPHLELSTNTAPPLLSKLLKGAHPEAGNFFFSDEKRRTAFAAACGRPDDWRQLERELRGETHDPVLFATLEHLGQRHGTAPVDHVMGVREAVAQRGVSLRIVVPKDFASDQGPAIRHVVEDLAESGVIVRHASPPSGVVELFRGWNSGPKAFLGELPDLPPESRVTLLSSHTEEELRFDPPDFADRLRRHGRVALPARPAPEVERTQDVTLSSLNATIRARIGAYDSTRDPQHELGRGLAEMLREPFRPRRRSEHIIGYGSDHEEPEERLKRMVERAPHALASLRELARGWPLEEVEREHGTSWPESVGDLITPLRSPTDPSRWSERWLVALWLGRVLEEPTRMPTSVIDDLSEQVQVQALGAWYPAEPERDGPLLLAALLALGPHAGKPVALHVPSLSERPHRSLVPLRTGPAITPSKLPSSEPAGPLTSLIRNVAGFVANLPPADEEEQRLDQRLALTDVTSDQAPERVARFGALLDARRCLDEGDHADRLDPRSALAAMLDLPLGPVHVVRDGRLSFVLRCTEGRANKSWSWKGPGLSDTSTANPHATEAITVGLWLRSALGRGGSILLAAPRGGRMRLTDLRGVYADVQVWQTTSDAAGVLQAGLLGAHDRREGIRVVKISTRYADTLVLPQVLWLEGGGFHARAQFGESSALDWVPPTIEELELERRVREEDDD